MIFKGNFYLEDIRVYFYSAAVNAYVTRTYFRAVNIITRSVTQDPDDDTDHGNGTSGNDNYLFTVNKLLDSGSSYQLKIDMLHTAATNYINGFRIRGHLV